MVPRSYLEFGFGDLDPILMIAKCFWSIDNSIMPDAWFFFLSKATTIVIPVTIFCSILTLVMLNKLKCHTHFQLSANQIAWSRLLIQIQILNNKQWRSRSVGFFRSQLNWIYTVFKSSAYPGSAGLGLMPLSRRITKQLWNYSQTFLQIRIIILNSSLLLTSHSPPYIK